MTPSRQDQQAAREARLDELHDKLTHAVDQLVSGEDWKRALAFAANFRSRSFNNTLLIWAQHAAAFEAGRVPELDQHAALGDQVHGFGVARGSRARRDLAEIAPDVRKTVKLWD